MSDREPEHAPISVTHHLTPEPVWLAHRRLSEYRPERFADEGFVHCTHGEELVLEVANRYYRGDPRPYLLLDVDLDRVAAPAIYEDDTRRYPHVYGPIERDAVLRVRRVDRAADGSFAAIGVPALEHLP